MAQKLICDPSIGMKRANVIIKSNTLSNIKAYVWEKIIST